MLNPDGAGALGAQVEGEDYVVRDTARACLQAGHWVRQYEGGIYVCTCCTIRNRRSVPKLVAGLGTYMYVAVRVNPLAEWTDHVHALVWCGFDGTDNYYECLHCSVVSYDHGAHGAYTPEQRAGYERAMRARRANEKA